MNGPRCHICDHEYNQHIQSGCQFTTCICKEFKVKKQEEKVNIQQNSATQNLREKLDNTIFFCTIKYNVDCLNLNNYFVLLMIIR